MAGKFILNGTKLSSKKLTVNQIIRDYVMLFEDIARTADGEALELYRESYENAKTLIKADNNVGVNDG